MCALLDLIARYIALDCTFSRDDDGQFDNRSFADTVEVSLRWSTELTTGVWFAFTVGGNSVMALA